MKKILILPALLFCLFLFPNEAPAAPKIELSPPVWDMGDIYQWADPSIVVKVKNTGDKDLVISDVRVSCGCTAVILSDKVIKPGKETTMKVNFASYSFHGPVRKDVTLVTNDPAATQVKFRINGRILDTKAAVGLLQPDYIDLGVMAPYETKFFMIFMKNKGNADLKSVGVKLPPGFFLDTGLPGDIPPRSGVSVRIGFKPQKPSGPIDEELRFTHAEEPQGKMRLKVVGYIGGEARSSNAVVLSPAGIKISPGTPNPSVEIAVKNEGGSAIGVEGADSSFDLAMPAAGNFQVKPGESGKVDLKLVPDGLKEKTKGYIYLRIAIPVEVEGAGGK